jgi:hypothetical protein
MFPYNVKNVLKISWYYKDLDEILEQRFYKTGI